MPRLRIRPLPSEGCREDLVEERQPWLQVSDLPISCGYRRAAVRREQPSGIDLDRYEPPPPEPAAAELQSELAACLRPLLERLAPPYRKAITLTEREGVTQVAAATRLGLSTSGMKSRVQRARAQLRDLLVSCCEIELDSRGAITSYQPRRTPYDCGSGRLPE